MFWEEGTHSMSKSMAVRNRHMIEMKTSFLLRNRGDPTSPMWPQGFLGPTLGIWAVTVAGETCIAKQEGTWHVSV